MKQHLFSYIFLFVLLTACQAVAEVKDSHIDAPTTQVQVEQPTTAPTQEPEPATPMPRATVTPNNTPTSIPNAAPALEIGESQVSAVDGMEQMAVPAGVFTMGSTKGRDDERPVHEVNLDAFWIDKYEVTNEQFQDCVADGGCTEPPSCKYGRSPYDEADKGNHPVICMVWQDAQDYCTWAGRALPTEAQWEKAARGTDERSFPWGDDFDGTRLNFCDKNCGGLSPDEDIDDGYARTAPVGNYPTGASPYGALDMAGNVFEWVADWYAPDYYENTPVENPVNTVVSFSRVLRGRSFNLSGRRITGRVSLSADYPEDHRGSDVGFRCAQPEG